MEADPLTDLPDRDAMAGFVQKMLDDGRRPAVFAVAVHGWEDTAGDGDERDPAGAMREVTRRLARLVRASDMLAVLGPGVFGLSGPNIARGDADVLLERIKGAFALPVQVGDDAVSFPVTVGIAYAELGVAGGSLLDAAEAELRRLLDDATG